jgi:imidazolonepropionase-like amidohydrolase
MIRSGWVLLVVTSMAVSQAPAQQGGTPETLRYSVMSNNTKSGAEIDTFRADGGVDSTFEYNDRGRGPKVTAHWTLNANGMPVSVDVTGNDYFKAPVDEHFSVANGKAHWKSTSEEGEAAEGRFYSGVQTPQVEQALLIRLLAHAGAAGVPLYPSGVAHLEKMQETTVHRADGAAMRVTEYTISGFSLEPTTIWMDDHLQFFASPGSWFAILREGWETTNDQLYQLQAKADQDRYQHLAQQLTRHPAQAVAIEHVRLFDSEHAATLEDQTVVVTGDRISAAGAADKVVVPSGAERIDGHGKTLLPGLFDMHVHVGGGLDGILHVASGVTSVRDMGNSIETLAQMDEQWRNGTGIGPRVAKAGLIDAPGPYQAPTGLFAATQAEANAAVNKYADLGYVQTKLYSSFDPKLVPEVIWLSHSRGMRVSGHVPSGMTARQFVEAGADEIQHINFIMLNFLADKVPDTRSTQRFSGVGEYANGIDLQSQEVKDFITLLVRHHTTVDVTLATFEDMFTARPGHLAPTYAPILDRLPPQVQRGAYIGGLPVTAANDEKYQKSWAAMLQMTSLLYKAGVPILAGTDDLPGLMLHRELELEVQTGIPPLQALRNATWVAATVLRQQRDLGSVTAGKLADLVLVEGDPGRNISDIRRCRMVFKGGAIYDSAKLYEAISIIPAK